MLACGALAAELRAVLSADSLADGVEVRYLPANLHNRPERIVPALREAIAQYDPHDDRPLFVAYADCGTGGGLDRLLEELPRATRLPGDHCYGFFAGAAHFAELHEEAPGTFYLTDFLAKHFEALVWQGLGLDRHPHLLPVYFGHYTRVLLLAQTDDPAVTEAARRGAEQLGLQFERRFVGLDAFGTDVRVALRSSVEGAR